MRLRKLFWLPYTRNRTYRVPYSRSPASPSPGRMYHVDEEPAVSIFGESGESVDVVNGNTGQLERVREPQRQFVERHEPSARTLAAGLGSRHTLPRLTPSSATRDGQIDSKPVSTADRIARASPGT